MAASVWIDGLVLTSLLLLCVFCALAALLLIWLVPVCRQRPFIVVDGSNVMYWQNEKPKIDTAYHVVTELARRGYDPLVWFDANVGYLISDRYLAPPALARMLKLPTDQVSIASSGTPADPLLLEQAVAMNVRVVSNDQFRDWTQDFPAVKQPGFLITGRVQLGQVSLDNLPDVGAKNSGERIKPAVKPKVSAPLSAAQIRRRKKADRARAKAMSPRRLMWAVLALPVVTASIAISVYVRTSPYDTQQAILHLAARFGCDSARSVGLAPAYRGELGYHARNDADGDGIACERYYGNAQPAVSRNTRSTATEERRAGGAKFVRP